MPNRAVLILAGIALSAATLRADQHTTGVPVLSSRPGAPYTIYLNTAGFNYSGTWSTYTPGNNLALNSRAANATFNANDQAEIRAIWAATAQAFYSFNVNVTTVDPAVAAGQAATDVARKNFYDSQIGLIHTVVGPRGNNWGGGDGISQFNTAATVAPAGSGNHTNWMFTEAVNMGSALANGQYIGAVAAHETGHSYNLSHQSDYTGNTRRNEYNVGDAGGGIGSYDAFMGNAYGTQRNAWRVGDSNNGAVNHLQDDVARMLSSNASAGFAYADSGNGHSFATAAWLPLIGNTVNASLARGVINPLSSTSPQPMGAANYTSDVFLFTSDGLTPTLLVCHDGTNFLSPGSADNGITLRSTLTIFDASFNQVGLATEDSSTLFESFTGTLPAGMYYASIASFGGHAQVNAQYNPANYYDMGGYFLTGSVPSPSAMSLLAIGLAPLVRRRSTG